MPDRRLRVVSRWAVRGPSSPHPSGFSVTPTVGFRSSRVFFFHSEVLVSIDAIWEAHLFQVNPGQNGGGPRPRSCPLQQINSFAGSCSRERWRSWACFGIEKRPLLASEGPNDPNCTQQKCTPACRRRRLSCNDLISSPAYYLCTKSCKMRPGFCSAPTALLY